MLLTAAREPPRRRINFHISIRQACRQYRGKFNLKGFVPSVDTAAENKARAIRWRITYARARREISVPGVQVSRARSKV